MKFAAAVALAVCLCLAGTARAAPVVGLRVTFNPDLEGQATTIEIGLRIGGPDSGPSSPVTSLGLRLPASMSLAGTMLGQANCDRAALLASGVKGCSGNARIGFGTASAIVPVGAQAVDEKATLNVFMGPQAANEVRVLWYVEATEPVFAQLVLPSMLEEAKEPYGQELATEVPLVETWPEGPDLALETFTSSIGPLGLLYHRQVDGKTLAYHPRGMRIPRACPTGGFPFAALLNFADGTKATAIYRVPCLRH
jgi:hypothetical protein